jgi:hypothetical protein
VCESSFANGNFSAKVKVPTLRGQRSMRTFMSELTKTGLWKRRQSRSREQLATIPTKHSNGTLHLNFPSKPEDPHGIVRVRLESSRSQKKHRATLIV